MVGTDTGNENQPAIVDHRPPSPSSGAGESVRIGPGAPKPPKDNRGLKKAQEKPETARVTRLRPIAVANVRTEAYLISSFER
jgi:hypothetical protein